LKNLPLYDEHVEHIRDVCRAIAKSKIPFQKQKPKGIAESCVVGTRLECVVPCIDFLEKSGRLLPIGLAATTNAT
jgi:hypothetical protein